MHVVPAVGGAVCGDSSGFKYLASSIREFPPQDTVVRELLESGFERADYHDCTGGIAAVYEAHKAPRATTPAEKLG